MSQPMAMAMTPPSSLNIFGRPLSIFGVPVDRKTIFANHKGVYKNHIEKRQRKLIIKTTFIKFYLHRDERILCLTTGYSPVSVKEQVFTGPAFLFFKRAFFVFTDRRILHVPSGFNQGARCAISQIRYDDCAALDLKGRTLIVMYKNGTQENFPYIGRKEKHKIAALLGSVQRATESGDGLHRRVYLCPSCTTILDQDGDHCPACKLEFKSRRRARVRAIVLPGGGYFYTHYSWLGFSIGLCEIAVFTHLLFNLMAFKEGIPVNFTTMALMTFILAAEKIAVTYHAEELTRNFIPEPKDYAMRKI